MVGHELMNVEAVESTSVFGGRHQATTNEDKRPGKLKVCCSVGRVYRNLK